MLKPYWEIIVFFSDQDPKTFYLEQERYSLELIIEVADIVMRKHGAVDYNIKEIWMPSVVG